MKPPRIAAAPAGAFREHVEACPLFPATTGAPTTPTCCFPHATSLCYARHSECGREKQWDHRRRRRTTEKAPGWQVVLSELRPCLRLSKCTEWGFQRATRNVRLGLGTTVWMCASAKDSSTHIFFQLEIDLPVDFWDVHEHYTCRTDRRGARWGEI